MAKTKFKFKIKELEIEFEGDQRDTPKVVDAMSNQLSGLMQTPGLMSDSQPVALPAPTTNEVIESKPKNLRKSRSKSSSGSSSGSSSSKRSKKEAPVDLNHDAEKWGNPQESWNPTNKAIWLMYVIENEVNEIGSITASRIASTFNKHFKSFGQIKPSNVSRDLKKAAKDKPAKVQTDTAKEGMAWFLLKGGKDYAAELVKQARGIK